jgi:hypothetical protein
MLQQEDIFLFQIGQKMELWAKTLCLNFEVELSCDWVKNRYNRWFGIIAGLRLDNTAACTFLQESTIAW